MAHLTRAGQSFPRNSLRTISVPASRRFSITPSSQLAKVILVGRMGIVPERQATSTGVDLIRYVVASSRPNQPTSWFKVTAFNVNPQSNYLTQIPKGTLVYVEGDIKLHKFESDGVTKQITQITHRRIEVLQKPRDTNAEEPTTQEKSSMSDDDATMVEDAPHS